jgi:hypothetical protein
MSKIVAVYVEDDERDGKKYSKLLSVKGRLTVLPIMAPSEPITNSILGQKPDLVLIDYLLSKKQPDGHSANYRGGTIATSIREKNPKIPLVLITRRALLQQYSGAPGQLGPFDFSIFKGEIRSEKTRIVSQLISLADGYRCLTEAKRLTWRKLLALMKARDDEMEMLAQCRPPSSRLNPNEPLTAHGATDWILNTISRYPGILYDQLHAATTLGVAVESFSRPSVSNKLSNASYDGIFGGLGKMWWKPRLLSQASRIVREAGMHPPLSKSFGPALKKHYGISVIPSECIYSGEKYADTVCFVLRKPVLYPYTLAYFPDDRPRVMEQARVSFSARKDRDFRLEYLDSKGRELIRKI